MGCPEEIDYTYVRLPVPTYNLSFREVRTVDCENIKHTCAECQYYSVCDSEKRTVVEGREWHPPMRSREEVEAELKLHVDPATLGWLRWVLGYAAPKKRKRRMENINKGEIV